MINNPEWVWKNFQWQEVLPPKTPLRVINPHLMDKVQALRDYIQTPILINDWHKGGRFKYRGYRTFWQNTRIGGSKNSYHVQTRALDMTAPALSINELGEAVQKFFNGVILYNTFVHGDSRFVEYFEDKRT